MKERTNKLSLEFTAYYSDTDSYGVVWHGSYLRWLEAGRVEYLRENGLDIMKLQDEDGIVLPLAALEIKYIAPVRCGERVKVITEPEETRNTWATFNQTIVSAQNPDKVYVKAHIKCGGVDREGKLVKNLKEILEVCQKEENTYAC